MRNKSVTILAILLVMSMISGFVTFSSPFIKTAKAAEKEILMAAELNKKERADKHYQAGLSYYEKGDYGNARKELLKALSYYPAHKESAALLAAIRDTKKKEVKRQPEPQQATPVDEPRMITPVDEPKIVAPADEPKIVAPVDEPKIVAPVDEPPSISPDTGYIVHIVQSGESFSVLARMYYKDYTKYPMIARYNQMDANAVLKVGQEIKIPVVGRITIPGPPDKKDPEKPPTTSPPKRDVDPYANARQLGIDFFEEKNYLTAITVFEKILEKKPGDKKTVDYISLSHFEQGKSMFSKGEYVEAINQFELALGYDPNCSDCKTYIDNSLLKKKEMARKAGMELFEKKQYQEAITEFVKYLEEYQDDGIALEKTAEAHFQLGLILYREEEFLNAMDEFKASKKYDKDCDKCQEYINKSENTYKEIHYNKGIKYMLQQNLDDAINELQAVYNLDPGYKDVNSNLDTAKARKKRLEEIREETKAR